MKRGNRRCRGFWLALACLIASIVLWTMSFTSVIARSDSAFCAALANGELEIQWGGDPSWRNHWFDLGLAYRIHDLEEPDVSVLINRGWPIADCIVGWTLFRAPRESLACLAFWRPARLGFRLPSLTSDADLRGFFPQRYRTTYTLLVPTPTFVAASAIVFAWFGYRRLRRYPVGHCSACGYDLTGNVSGCCSECGEPVPRRRGAEPPSSPKPADQA